MSDTLKMPDPPEKRGSGDLESTARVCPSCGKTFQGSFHQDCPSTGQTLKKLPSSDSSIDELPAEAKAFDTDPSRQLNHYVLVKQVGRGGMGAVWKAWDRSLTRWVAIKFLLVQEEPDILRFQREAKLAARLRHPNIAAIYEVGRALSTQPGQSFMHFLAMEFIDGQSLQETKLALPETVEMFIKIAQGIEAAHRGGVVHRDLKPQNVMVTRDGWPYVMDFGLAKALQGDSSLSVSGSVMGTPAFMPPEQAEGRLSDIDARSDIYSLGATLYAVLSGRPPFRAQTALEILSQVSKVDPSPLRSISPEVPEALESIVRKAMAKKNSDRYASMTEMAQDLKQVFSLGPVASGTPRPEAPLPRRSGLLVVVALTLVALGAGAYFMMNRKAEPARIATALAPPPVKPAEPVAAPPVPVQIPVPAAVKPVETPAQASVKPVEAPLPVVVPTPAPTPPPPPEPDPDELEWRRLQALLSYDTWAAGDALLAGKAHLHLIRALPKGTSAPAAGVTKWFGAEIDKARTVFRQEQRTAEQQLAIQRRIAGWCEVVARVARDIPELQEIEKKAAALRTEVEPKSRGVFTLKLVPIPFAQIDRLTCDGRPVAFKRQETPIVLENLEIGDYEIDLTNPDSGLRKVLITGKDLKDRAVWLISGKMTDPALKSGESR